MIPELDASTGHLPPGRYRTSLAEIKQEFVDAPRFARSATRTDRFVGLVAYCDAWNQVQLRLGTEGVLMSLWIGGSFTSSELDPDDVDVSPIVDGTKLRALTGSPGVKPLRSLFGHRIAVKAAYGVEPFPITWMPVESPLAGGSSSLEADYYHNRGTMDDFWQRVRPSGPKRPATTDDVHCRRGYLEVIV